MRMLRATMCAMNRSENAACLWSISSIVRLSTIRTVVGAPAVVLPDWTGARSEPGQDCFSIDHSHQPSAISHDRKRRIRSAGGAEIKLDGKDYLIVKEQEVFSRHRKVDRGDKGERVIKGL